MIVEVAIRAGDSRSATIVFCKERECWWYREVIVVVDRFKRSDRNSTSFLLFCHALVCGAGAGDGDAEECAECLSSSRLRPLRFSFLRDFLPLLDSTNASTLRIEGFSSPSMKPSD